MLGPSTIPFDANFPVPQELSIRRSWPHLWILQNALKTGVDVIEIHNAHGYLLFSFPTPQSNKRTDEFGGSFENNIRLTLEVVDTIRDIIPSDMPLFLRYAIYC